MHNKNLDSFLQLPVFMGLTPDSVLRIFEKNQITFNTYHMGDVIAEKGRPIEHLKCFLSGEVVLDLPINENLRISQQVTAPFILCPNYYFGFNRSYPYDVLAFETTGGFDINRKQLYKLSKQNEIIFMNLINQISNAYQQTALIHDLTFNRCESHRFSIWVLSNTHPKGQDINVSGSLDELAKYLKTNTEKLSQELYPLQRNGIISMNQGELYCPNRKLLLDYLLEH